MAEVIEIMKKQKVGTHIGKEDRRCGKKEEETSSDCKYTSQKCSFFTSEKKPIHMEHLDTLSKTLRFILHLTEIFLF